MNKTVRRSIIAALALFCALLLAVTALFVLLEFRASDRILQPLDSPTAPTAVILGARAYEDGNLSEPLEQRVLTGFGLYLRGTVRNLLVSGDNSRGGVRQTDAMRERLLSLGVPEISILEDPEGIRTISTCFRARRLFGLGRVLLVSQRYHLPRALYLADAAGLDAVGVIAPAAPGDRLQWGREFLARPLAWAEIALGVSE
jgi:vancomycin permeability regulator SanA